MRAVHAIYCDIASSETGRYQALAAISGTTQQLSDLRGRLSSVSSGHSETKFSNLTGDSQRSRTAADFIELAVADAHASAARVDVRSWDLRDSRNAIKRRDDIANIGRMAYHLFIGIVKRHTAELWELYPDHGDGVDWDQIAEYLAATNPDGPARMRSDHPQLVQVDRPPVVFSKVKCLDSCTEPLIQLADLFAGMVCFSHEDGDACLRHVDALSAHATLDFGCDTEEPRPTRAKAAKYGLVAHLNACCKRRKLGVSLRTERYLVTKMPSGPIQIRHHQPQGDYDKAPTKM